MPLQSMGSLHDPPLPLLLVLVPLTPLEDVVVPLDVPEEPDDVDVDEPLDVELDVELDDGPPGPSPLTVEVQAAAATRATKR
jgi:hypothetical protein